MIVGCQPKTDPQAPTTSADAKSQESTSPATPLRVLVVDDEPLAEAIARQWKAHARESLEMTTVTSDQWKTKVPDADVLVYPSSFLGQLVKERVIVPWPAKWQPLGGQTTEESTLASYDWDGILPQLARHELRWANELYGVGFGSPQFLLFYRADLLRAWNLQPPSTWQEYQSLLGAINERLQATPNAARVGEPTAHGSGASPEPIALPRFATIEPLASGWAAKVVLARSTAYARHPNQYSTFFNFVSMEALIDQPPYQRAFDELRADVRFMPPDVWNCDPDQVMNRFLSGESVMAWGWPSRARGTVRPEVPGIAGAASMQFGVAPLPGSLQVYQIAEAKWEDRNSAASPSVSLLGVSGRMGSITRRCRFPDAACNLLLWLTGNEASAQVATKSRHTSVFRLAHLNQPTPWVESPLEPIAGDFAAVVSKLQANESVMSLRIPGQEDYLAALDEAVRSSSQPTTTQVTLKLVAQKWNEITNQRNRDQQRQAYAESLGLQAP